MEPTYLDFFVPSKFRGKRIYLEGHVGEFSIRFPKRTHELRLIYIPGRNYRIIGDETQVISYRNSERSQIGLHILRNVIPNTSLIGILELALINTTTQENPN